MRVWAGISATAKPDLDFIKGSPNAQRYNKEVLTPHVLQFQACTVNDFLHTNNINRMDWPTMSPDLSCIEPVWDVLERVWSATAHCRMPA